MKESWPYGQAFQALEHLSFRALSCAFVRFHARLSSSNKIELLGLNKKENVQNSY